MDTPRRVFISYTHDSPSHIDKVVALATKLCKNGVDCMCDKWVQSPEKGWPLWMLQQIHDADWVLVVCTRTYKSRFEQTEPAGRGKGAKFEGLVITHEVYNSEGKNSKFIPIILCDDDLPFIPSLLSGATRCNLSKHPGFEDLLRIITEQPEYRQPSIGTVPLLPAKQIGGTSDTDGAERRFLAEDLATLQARFEYASDRFPTLSCALVRFDESARKQAGGPPHLATEAFSHTSATSGFFFRDVRIRPYTAGDDQSDDRAKGDLPWIVRDSNGQPIAVREPAIFGQIVLWDEAATSVQRMTALAELAGRTLAKVMDLLPIPVGRALAEGRGSNSPQSMWIWQLFERAWESEGTGLVSARRLTWMAGEGGVVEFPWEADRLRVLQELGAPRVREFIDEYGLPPAHFYSQLPVDPFLASALALGEVVRQLRAH